MDGITMSKILVKLTEDPRETLNKTKSTRSNVGTHAPDFVALRFIQRILTLFSIVFDKNEYTSYNINHNNNVIQEE